MNVTLRKYCYSNLGADYAKGLLRHAINKKAAEVKERNKNECFRPGSNRRPSACETDVITTTLRKRRLNGILNIVKH